MLMFNVDAFHHAIKQIGYEEEELRSYKELILSEINYLNYFLYFLNDDDINQLLMVYDHKKFMTVPGEMAQEQLRYIYNSLKALRHEQQQLLKAFYRPNPIEWQMCLQTLGENYIQYLSLSHKIPIPVQVDEKFKQIQEAKVAIGYPRVGALGAILIAPVQRIPRYGLLAKEMMKSRAKNAQSEVFQQQMVSFIDTVDKMGRQLNAVILKLDQDKARQLIKKINITPKRQLSTAVSLLSDLQVLDYDEVKRVLDNFDFSACANDDDDMLRNALAIDSNKKYTAYFENKIILDKLISLIKELIELQKKSQSIHLQILVSILQSLNNQRGIGTQCDMRQAFWDAYQVCREQEIELDKFMQIITDSLLNKINLIYQERQHAPLTSEQIKEFIRQAEEPTSPYLDHSGRLYRSKM